MRHTRSISSPPPAANVKSRGKKRAREDDLDESGRERGQCARKIQKTAPCTAAPLALVGEVFDEELQYEIPAAPSPTNEEDFIDEYSVELILDGVVEGENLVMPTVPTMTQDEIAQNIDSDYNSFLPSDEESNGEAEVVEIEDETGERHRRYSAVAKGKGRAIA